MTIDKTEHRRDGRRRKGRAVTKAQENRLIRKAKGGEGVPPDKRARRKLMKLMRPLVEKEAKKQANLGVDFDDLVQVGEEAVLEALERYTPQGWWFDSYARSWIHGRMRRAIANQARTIRVPEDRVEVAGKNEGGHRAARTGARAHPHGLRGGAGDGRAGRGPV